MDSQTKTLIQLNAPQLLYLWRLAWLCQIAAYVQQQSTKPTTIEPKPLQEKKSPEQECIKEKPYVTVCCIKKKWSSVRRCTSSVPIFANGALSGAFGYLFNQVAGRNRRAAQLAAARQTAQTRSPDTIYITGHRVGVAGPYHTAIEYVDTSGHSEWLSAGPDGVSREGLVSLLSAPGRSSDHPSLNRLFGRVIPPSGMSSASYFQELQSADAFYCDCVDYDLFPGMANGYNSNSYVNSLIGVTGGSTTVNLGGFVGGGKTIPEMYFW